MDVKSLYTFISVVDHGSFAQAAEALGLSASAISVQMRGLEADVETRLFDRSRRPPVLTPEGREFADRARAVIATWEELSETLRRDRSAGLLRIGAVHTAVSSILPAALRRLRQDLPDLEIHLSTGLAHELDTRLRTGLIDAAVTTAPQALPAGIEFFTVCEERLVVIAHGNAEGRDFREILGRNPYVRFNRHARVATMIDAALARHGIRVSSRMEIDTLDGVLALVAAGLGVSIVPDHMGLRSFRERVHPLGDPPPVRRLGIMIDPGSPRRHFCDAFFTSLRQVAREAGLVVPPLQPGSEGQGDGTG